MTNIETFEELLDAHEWVEYSPENSENACTCGWAPTGKEINQYGSRDAAHTHHVAVQLSHTHLSTLKLAWFEGHEAGWDDRDEMVNMNWTPSSYNGGPGNPYKEKE